MSIINTLLSTYNILVDRVSKLVKIGSTSNYTQFGTDGGLTLVGDSSRWDDIIGNRVLGTGSLSPAVSTVLGNLKLPGYTNVGSDEEFWMFEILHNTKLISLADIHFHMLLANTSNSGNVKMNCEYWIKHNGTTLPAGVPLSVTKALTGSDALKSVDFEFTTTLDLSGLTIGDHIIVRITRDNGVASNLSATIFSVQAGIHRQLDGFGSSRRLVK